MIEKELLEKFEKRFNESKDNIVVKNAIQSVGINSASINQEVLNRHNFVYSHETEKGKITNQKKWKMLDVCIVKYVKN